MKKVYNIIHMYDTDGGFGDAISQEKVIATFSDYKDAKKFVEKWQKPHVYSSPYNDLHCGNLKISAMNVIKKG